MQWAELGALTFLRLKLLLRQRLGWLSVATGCLLVLVAVLVAQVSFVSPQKIFWDFSLGICFVLQVGLALFLGSQLYNDEKNRRTLHLILSSGVSRLSWLVGNGLGIFLALLVMNTLWFLLMLGAAYLNFSAQGVSVLMPLQAQLMLMVEVLLLIFFGLFLSLCVRPLLALIGGIIVTVLLHCLSDLQRIFTDPQVGRYVEDRGINVILWLTRLLPPLEWLDLKVFVGYQPSVDWFLIVKMTFLGLLWTLLFVSAAWVKFDGMDL